MPKLQFDTVKSTLPDVDSCMAEIFDKLSDIFFFHYLGHFSKDNIRDRRRSPDR